MACPLFSIAALLSANVCRASGACASRIPSSVQIVRCRYRIGQYPLSIHGARALSTLLKSRPWGKEQNRSIARARLKSEPMNPNHPRMSSIASRPSPRRDSPPRHSIGASLRKRNRFPRPPDYRVSMGICPGEPVPDLPVERVVAASGGTPGGLEVGQVGLPATPGGVPASADRQANAPLGVEHRPVLRFSCARCVG